MQERQTEAKFVQFLRTRRVKQERHKLDALGGGRKGLRGCGFALFLAQFCGNFIFTCGISVLLDYAVCGLKKVLVTVIGDGKVSAVLRFHWDPLPFCFLVF